IILISCLHQYVNSTFIPLSLAKLSHFSTCSSHLFHAECTCSPLLFPFLLSVQSLGRQTQYLVMFGCLSSAVSTEFDICCHCPASILCKKYLACQACSEPSESFQ